MKLLCTLNRVGPLLPRDTHRCLRVAAMAKHGAYNERWETNWTSDGGLKPGQMFDAAGPSPALLHLLGSKAGLVEAAGKRAFVPGCGRGYDLTALVGAGAAQAVGLELAPSAVAAARKHLAQQPELTPEAVPVVEGDFFQWTSPAGPFDLGFDYTFLCALHPDTRADWGAAWARALRPGGQLVTLIFPVDAGMPQQGPPWPVTPDLYKRLLLPSGFELQSLEAVPPERSHPKRAGKEYLGVWRRV